jgi:hydroxyacylglutathione hydrolase
MAIYLATLARLEKLRLSRICPGHGDVIEDPKARIQDYVAHRAAREKQIVGLLKGGPLKIPELVQLIYGGEELAPGLVEAAGWQVHAQLLKLKADGKVTGSSVKSAWKLA